MNPVFWIGLGVLGFGMLAGVVIGARDRNTGARAGALIGAYLGLMCAFPLLAIGLSIG